MQATELVTELHDEHDIDLTEKGKENLTTMCKLGEGIYEKGMVKGMEQGIVRTALNMLKQGISIDVVAKCTELPIDAITSLAKKNKLI
ncbi:MAG: transposase [Megasphaera sp.]|nr:transposase [Megasphaera sp.]